jgi:hypothetical protein
MRWLPLLRGPALSANAAKRFANRKPMRDAQADAELADEIDGAAAVAIGEHLLELAGARGADGGEVLVDPRGK